MRTADPDVEVLAPLATSAESVVVRARLRRSIASLRRGARVVLKFARTDDGRILDALDREAALLSRVRSPHVVRSHGVHSLDVPGVGRRRAHVTSIASGEPLSAYLRRAGPLPEDALRSIARQAAMALCAAHAAGVVHCDVKPDNLVLSRAGRLRLVDFGFATDRPSDGSPEFRATPAYAAPERILGDAAGARSDLYSLGATLYEAACGEPPFGRDPSLALLRRHVEETPVSPAARCVILSPDLESLVLDLLAKDPADRPATARDVVARLDGVAGPRVPGAVAASRATASPAATASAALPMLGRAAEARALRSAVTDGDTVGIVAVLGGPSSGKTRLAREVLGDRAAGWTRAGRDDPVGMLVDLLRDAVVVPGLEATAVRRGAFVEARLLAGERIPQADRWALDAIARRAREHAGHPWVVVVDDAHALTPSEADALRALTTLPGAPTSVVLLARGAQATPSARPFLDGARVRLDLAPLSVPAVDALCVAAGAGPSARRVLVPRLTEAAQGVAGLVVDAIERLRADGALDTGREDWSSLVDAAGLSRGRADAGWVESMLASLDAEQRDVVEAAAVLGPAFDPFLLARLTSIRPLRLASIVSSVVHRQRLLAVEGSRVRFVPDSLAAAIESRLDVGRRRALHAAAAQCTDDDAARLRHLSLAGDIAPALRDAPETVRRLRESGRNVAALRLVDTILAESGPTADPATVFDLEMERLQSLKRIPGRAGVAEAYPRLLARSASLDAARRARAIEEHAGYLIRMGGDVRGALRAYRSAYGLRRAAGDERGRARIAAAVANWTLRRDAGARRRRLLREAARVADGTGDPALVAEIAMTRCQWARIEGRPAEALREARRARRAGRAAGAPMRSVEALVQVADTLVRAGRCGAAKRWLRRALREARASELASSEASVCVWSALADAGLGRAHRALARLDASSSFVASFGDAWIARRASLARAWILGQRGRVEEARAAYVRIAEAESATGASTHRWWAWTEVAYEAAAAGDRLATASAARRARAAAHGDRAVRLRLRVAFARAEAVAGSFARAGRHARAALVGALPAIVSWDARYASVLAAVLPVLAGTPSPSSLARARRAVRRTDDPWMRAMVALAAAAARPEDAHRALVARRRLRRVRDAHPFDRRLLAALADRARLVPEPVP